MQSIIFFYSKCLALHLDLKQSNETKTMKRKHTGLTMTEALIVLAVVGTLAAVAVPSMTVFLDNGQLSADTNDLFSSLLIARSEAVTRNNRVVLCKIDPSDLTACAAGSTWQAGWLAFVDEDNDVVLDVGEDIVNTYTGMSSNTAVTSAAFANTISYFPSGTSNTNGSFIICVNNSIAAEIFINATGRPRVADSACP